MRSVFSVKPHGPPSVVYLSQHVMPGVYGYGVTHVRHRGLAAHEATHASRLAEEELDRSQFGTSMTPLRPVVQDGQ